MQKIQAIKMIVGIFICSVRHCLKSYMKKSEFEAHIYESHYHILYPNAEEGIESEEQSQKGHSATDSTAGAPPRQVFSPGHYSLQHEPGHFHGKQHGITPNIPFHEYSL
ncbi:hypothetical protein SAY87_012256 [Trapa incisa]|uniref:C2H2-type domain-containing protein n=1 Tax=Trapa incisa TaxID=236973 RepID=A0AAN7JIR3_9MYRT|nr:hypothetical protein SAY87_012256 [Trapa incisa]